ncbi:multiheme c-type cytochrome [Acidicapsa dinghuensis]|uniref:Multiheme c-type cytochrome n=2 Tax=Acidicapsa dinghuensis TaxID=2218256 RepID=A0ABW1E985_9BACT
MGAGLLVWCGGATRSGVVFARPGTAAWTQGSDEPDPNAECARCHQAIYERYRKTPMANASGPAAAGFLPGEFTHAESGVTFRLEKTDGRVFLSFERDVDAGRGENANSADWPLKGQRELRYFLGSGRRGRTYLFEQDGYWFEIPVNWYAKKRIWDMAPNYLHATEMPLTMPVDPGCLRCHSSGAQSSLPEARNKYAAAPFLHGGITCTACHGDAAEHVASGGKMRMLDLKTLKPLERDSICLNCHLEGDVAIEHKGKRWEQFKPGESIFDYASYFVVEGGKTGDERATSQWEALLKSGCKRGEGDRLTCTSCHDPHGSVSVMSAEERAEYYRRKCLQCHDPEAVKAEGAEAKTGFAATHHAENRDCTACHMPRVRAEDIAHEQVTDHSIPRIAQKGGQSAVATKETLEAIGTEPGVAQASSERDLGLAYAQRALRGDRAAGERALELLRASEADLAEKADAPLHESLGLLDQVSDDLARAEKEYGMALAADPHDAVAAGDLALIRARAKDYSDAVRLWRQAFEENPVELGAGHNLAVMECATGDKEAALATLARIFVFSPDDAAAHKLDREIRSDRGTCEARAGTR